MRFAENDLTVLEITLACSVGVGMGDKYHYNRPNHGLAIIQSGKNHYVFDDGKTVDAMAGGILYLPKGSTYTVDSRHEGDCFAINFDIAECLEAPPAFFKLRNSQVAVECFKRAEKAWRMKNPGYKTAVMAELYSILTILRSEFEAQYIPTRKSNQIKRAVDFIHSEYTDSNLSLPDIAATAGVSEVYFRRIFMAEFGITPIRYINQMRFERAKELLRSGDYPIREVSQLAGFSDEVYFSRAFRTETGQSPSEYRNETLESIGLKQKNDTINQE